MLSTRVWRSPTAMSLGSQYGTAVAWLLLLGVVAMMLLAGPAGSTTAHSAFGHQGTKAGGQSHCGIVVGIGAHTRGSGSGDASCVNVQSGGDSQVNTGGFGDIGLQVQNSPVNAPIYNTHISNGGDGNVNNTINGNSSAIINAVSGLGSYGPPSIPTATPSTPATTGLPMVAPSGTPTTTPTTTPAVTGTPAATGAPVPATGGGQSHCGIVAGNGATAGGSGSGDTDCVNVQSGGDSQVNTRGFGDIGMQFQDSPVNAPITNVHVSNEGDNNVTNVITGDNNVIINNVTYNITINT
jgi:hypothetical protein